MKNRIVLLVFLISVLNVAHAKTEKFGTWIELEFTKKIKKKFEFSLIPEFRLQDDFAMDEYIFEGKLAYEPLKFLDLAASYRYNTNVKAKGNEISHSLVFDATGKTKFNRFKASLRTRFANETDSGDNPLNEYFFRPRAKLQYNIRKTKMEPYTSYELFYNLKGGVIYKGRFDVGFGYEVMKIHNIGLYYRMQDYFEDRNTIHILGINYQLKI